jgi:hypothetical protein
MRRALALFGVMGLTLSACGADDATDTTTPADPDAVVLTVTSEGGFVPVEFNLDRMPQYLVTADRSLYYQGPTTLEFPGPMLPNVQVTTIDEDTYAEMLDLIEELGLSDIDEKVDQSAAQNIADAGTTYLNYHDDNGLHRYGFYALEMTDGGSTDRLLANEIVEFLDQASASGESREYEPDRLQVAAGPPMQVDEGMGSVEEWPLDVSFQEMDEWGLGWRCVEVTGEEVTELLEVFSSANQATVWDTGSEQLGIRAHPLLPGETACQNAPQTS